MYSKIFFETPIDQINIYTDLLEYLDKKIPDIRKKFKVLTFSTNCIAIDEDTKDTTELEYANSSTPCLVNVIPFTSYDDFIAALYCIRRWVKTKKENKLYPIGSKVTVFLSDYKYTLFLNKRNMYDVNPYDLSTLEMTDKEHQFLIKLNDDILAVEHQEDDDGLAKD